MAEPEQAEVQDQKTAKTSKPKDTKAAASKPASKTTTTASTKTPGKTEEKKTDKKATEKPKTDSKESKPVKKDKPKPDDKDKKPLKKATEDKSQKAKDSSKPLADGSEKKRKAEKEEAEGASQTKKGSQDKPKTKQPEKPSIKAKDEKMSKLKGALAAEALAADDEETEAISKGHQNGLAVERSRSRSQKPHGKEKNKARKRHEDSSESESDEEESENSSDERRRRARRESAGLKAASGFGVAPPPAAPLGDVGSALSVLPEHVKGLIVDTNSLAQEAMRMKIAIQAATGAATEPRFKLDAKDEVVEKELSIGSPLRESLLDPSIETKLLARTGLLSITMNERKVVVLRAPSKQVLTSAMSVLGRVAHHCQWGCSPRKVSALLNEKPDKPIHTVVVRLAGTSSRLSTAEGKLTKANMKMRIGTDAKECQVALEGIPGISRKHVTITFEQDRGACYVQDMSTNGTWLNGRRLPRPPFRNPMDARVRLFHGDELMFREGETANELGYIVNIFELI